MFWTLQYSFANIFNFLRPPNCPRSALGLYQSLDQSRSCILKISDPPHNCVLTRNGSMTSYIKVNAKQYLSNSNQLIVLEKVVNNKSTMMCFHVSMFTKF